MCGLVDDEAANISQTSNDRAPWGTKLLSLMDTDVNESGPGYVALHALKESLRPLDHRITCRRISSVLTQLGFRDRHRFAGGIHVYIDSPTIETAKKLIGDET